MKRSLLSGIVLAAFALLCIPAVYAATADTGQQLVLKPSASAAGAEGTVLVRQDTQSGKTLVAFTVRKLQPDGVYTAELLNTQSGQTMGIGEGAASFKADTKGFAAYSGLVTPEDLNKWHQFQVTYHPDGNPRSESGASVILSAPVKLAK